MTTSAAALAILLALWPLNAHRAQLPGWAETPEARRVRFESISADVGVVVDASCTGKPASCTRWALTVLLGISFHESGWAADVDAGQCYRGPGFHLRCDSGLAWTIFQLIGGGEEARGWVADRKLATREALHRATRSWNACRKLEPALRWSVYARGRCTDPDGQRLSRELDAAIQRAARAMPKD